MEGHPTPRGAEPKLTGEELRSVLRARVIRMNAIALGITTGLLLGLGLFAATNFLLLRDGPGAGPHLALLGQFFLGYRVSFIGSLIGFGWACAVGFLAAYVGARIYNSVSDWRTARAEARKAEKA